MEFSRFHVNIESQPSQDQIPNGYLFHQLQNQRLQTKYPQSDHHEKQQQQEDESQ